MLYMLVRQTLYRLVGNPPLSKVKSRNDIMSGLDFKIAFLSFGLTRARQLVSGEDGELTAMF